MKKRSTQTLEHQHNIETTILVLASLVVFIAIFASIGRGDTFRSERLRAAAIEHSRIQALESDPLKDFDSFVPDYSNQ